MVDKEKNKELSGRTGQVPSDPVALKRYYAPKLELLIKREREVNGLMQQIQEINRWVNASAEMATRISAGQSIEQSLKVLTDGLVTYMGFDYADATWSGTIRVTSPEWHDEVDNARLTAVRCTAFEPEFHFWDEDGQFGACCAFTVASTHSPMDRVCVIGAYTRRTLSYLDDVRKNIPRLYRLADVLVHPFDALRLRLDLVKERDSLKERVDDATADLRHALEEAQSARAAAEHAANARTNFLANMSHEIRTPMTAILGYSHILSHGDVPEQAQKNHLEVIRKSGEHLLQLINDILDLARIESGRFEIDDGLSSPAHVILDVASLLNVRAAQANISLDVEFSSPLPGAVHIDGSRLRQILLNIVGNAIKFTKEGGVKVTAGFTEQSGNMGELVIDIEDTGIGIPLEAQATIFDAFEQGDRSLTREYGGTGLGLAISQKLASLMDGEITLTSTPGQGSLFRVILRGQIAENTTWISSPVSIPPEPTTDVLAVLPQLQGKVLLAEDTPVVQAVMTHWLEKMGLEVEHAENGEVVLSRVLEEKRQYDLILMDMQMPKLDGYDACKQLRNADCILPIIASTAHAMVGDREKCIAAGCTDYVTKPVDQMRMATVLLKYLGSSSEHEGSIPPGANPPSIPAGLKSENDDVLNRLRKDFLQDLLDTQKKIDAALRAANVRDVSRLAHRISGSAATFEYGSLAAAARVLEHCAPAKVEDETAAAIEALYAEIDKAMAS